MDVIKVFLEIFKPVLEDFNKIMKKPIFILLWIFFLPLTSVVICSNIILGLLNFIFLFFIFLKNIFITKIFKNKEKVILYKNKIYWLKNSYLIFICYQVFEVPRKYSFFYFYNFIYTLKNFNSNNFKLLLINIFIRYLFLIITFIPILVVKANNKIIKKIILLNNYNF